MDICFIQSTNYMAYTFIISDESVNSNGFCIQTQGIRTERFTKNPVMLYMHEREKGIIGRWDNIRTEGSQLLADAVFDEDNPLGKEVKSKIDSGFMRSASISVTINKYEDIGGVETVTDCELVEVSIVDIPSNQNAIKLFNKKGRIVLRLKDLSDESKDLRARLLEVLKLPAIASDDQIIDAVTALVNGSEQGDTGANKALNLGYIESSQLSMLKLLEKSDKPAFRQFMQEKEKETTEAIDKDIRLAIRKGKFIIPERSAFEKIGKQLGIKALKEVLAVLPEKVEFSKLFGAERNDLMNRANWGLNEYRKYASQELKDNPDLYTRLKEKEYGEEGEPYHDLAYYRKHNPEYLAQHPDRYKELLARERNNK